MANITSARGNLILAGDWKEEDIALFQPVLKKLELPEDFDMSELEEDESDEDFDLWYAGLK